MGDEHARNNAHQAATMNCFGFAGPLGRTVAGRSFCGFVETLPQKMKPCLGGLLEDSVAVLYKWVIESAKGLFERW